MTYTGEVVEELVHLPLEEDEQSQLAEFAAFIFTSGYLRFSAFGRELVIRVTRPAAARRLLALARRLFTFSVAEMTYAETAFEKWYEISFSGDNLLEVLRDRGLVHAEFSLDYISRGRNLLRSEEARAAFLRGIFLASGYVQNPARGRHLELHFRSEEAAGFVTGLLAEEGLHPHQKKRKHSYIVYLKNYEDIKRLFYKIGAVKMSLALENQQALRQLKNDVNRRVNFEKANLARTSSSAMEQLHAIVIIDEAIGIENLTPALREAAQLRLNYPEATLAELASRMRGVKTKSGAAHRLQRLVKLARKISKARKGEE